MPKFGFQIPRVRRNGRRHEENNGRRHRQWNESPVVSEPTADHPRYPARFNELPWYRSNVPCMEACPVHTDSGRYVQLIADGRLEDAFLIARAPNPLASVCGRVCSAPCEDACRRGWVDEAVTIRPLKRFITEQFGAESARPDFFRDPDRCAGRQTPKRYAADRPRLPAAVAHGTAVSTINPVREACGGVEKASPSSAADPPASDAPRIWRSWAMTSPIFEALPDSGGMLRYGIPDYRLPRGGHRP